MKAKVRVGDIANALALVAQAQGSVLAMAKIARTDEHVARAMTDIVGDLEAVMSDMTGWIEECGR